MTNQITMFYGGCRPLCRREVGDYRRVDSARRVRWIDSTVQGQLESFCVTQPEAMARLRVMDVEGQMQTGAAAFVALWSVLP